MLTHCTQSGIVELWTSCPENLRKEGEPMNNVKLKEVIQNSGIKVSALADKIGISRQSLHMKLNGERNFDQGEIMSLKTHLHLSDDQFIEIFFSDGVDNLSQKETV